MKEPHLIIEIDDRTRNIEDIALQSVRLPHPFATLQAYAHVGGELGGGCTAWWWRDRNPLRRGNWPGMEATQLISQELRPYCSSSVSNRLRDAGGVLSLPLIDVLGTPNSWNDWLERYPQGEPEHLQRFSVDSFAIAASMAVESAGICLLNEELLQGSRLREFLLCPLEQTIPSQASFYLFKHRDRPLSSAALAFTDWLYSELR